LRNTQSTKLITLNLPSLALGGKGKMGKKRMLSCI